MSTWGGGFLPKKIDGEHHAFVSEFVGGCGVASWRTNSQVVHFSAPSPKGPWQRKDVALPIWASCPSAAVAPNGTIVMWSMLRPGVKTVPRLGPDPVNGQRCVGGATPCGFAKHGCNSTGECKRADGSTTRCCNGTACPSPPMPPGSGSSSLSLVVSTAGPAGPWTSFTAELTEPVPYAIAAPLILPNGTAFFVLQSLQYPRSWPINERIAAIGIIVRAETWEGPYTIVARGACSPGEDHSLYVDTKGHIHCLSHRAPVNATLRDGGHSFSITGADPWFCVDGKGGHGRCTQHSPPAYNTTIVYAKGGQQAPALTHTASCTLRDRPHFSHEFYLQEPLNLVHRMEDSENRSAAVFCIHRWCGCSLRHP